MLAGFAAMADSGAASTAFYPRGSSAAAGASCDQGPSQNRAKAAANSVDLVGASGAIVSANPAARRKTRGRPRGSKNKPKAATVVVTRENEASMRAVVLELPGGFDVVAGVLGFARRRGVGISVLSGCGGVSDVTLRHPGCSSTLTFRGLFDILSLTGAFLPAAPRWSSSAPFGSASSHFTISLAGSPGELIGGVVEGPLIAAGTVRLMVATFASLEIQKLPPPPPRGEEGEEEGGGTMVVALGEGGKLQTAAPMVQLAAQQAPPPPAGSSKAMQMVYNVGPVGGGGACSSDAAPPVVEAAVPSSWSSNPAVRGDGGGGGGAPSRFRNNPASNQFHRYY